MGLGWELVHFLLTALPCSPQLTACPGLGFNLESLQSMPSDMGVPSLVLIC